jgi:hypothetical protein
VIFVDPLLELGLVMLAVYGLERLFVDLVRFVDRRTRRPKGPTGFVPPK